MFTVVSPATEQSGVGHSITYLSPLVVKEVFESRQRRGWAVEGSPADCVKIGLFEFCPRRPDIVVSGINGGLNAGINVLYPAQWRRPSKAPSLASTAWPFRWSFEDHANFDRAAALARGVIEQILAQKGPEPRLYNMNIPTAALTAGGA